jgi:hypothetical protein
MFASILSSIQKLQSAGSKDYPAGLFPSQRIHPATNYCREDNNIFFSALIVFTLQQIRHHFPQNLSSKIDQICKLVISNYPLYRHYADKSTYNFWQDGPGAHFPNGYLFKRIPFMALPADSDDTSIIYLTNPKAHSVQDIKQKLESHYLTGTPVSPLVPETYANLSTYPTFLGRKMKPEYDACVLCNILFMVFKFRLKLNQADHHAIEFIRRVLISHDYQRRPFSISPNYNNSTVILYHIARLVGSFEHAVLQELRTPLFESLDRQLQHTSSFMESLLLKTSLMRLGVYTPPLNNPADWHKVFNQFYFFQAGMLTGFQKNSLNRLAANPFTHLKFRCQAYYKTLWLEYKVLQHAF